MHASARTTDEILPLSERLEPADQAAVMEAVRAAHDQRTAIFPLGGETSLDYGLAPSREGRALSLRSLNRVVDYPARDMTITIEAGVTWSSLSERLAAERQRVPIDVPYADRATVGGVMATNHSGPRRFGSGTIADYVIGVSAVDGRGVPFKAGGRVVKNVAGYDFCKLLTGSLGTLAVITQVTLKVKPVPEASAFVSAPVDDVTRAEELLASLVTSQTTPAAIEWLVGPEWSDEEPLSSLPSSQRGRLLVGVEGTAPEVRWMVDRLTSELVSQGAKPQAVFDPAQVDQIWQQLTENQANRPAAIVLKICVVPSATTTIVERLVQADPACSIQAHAGNGIVLASFAQFTSQQVHGLLVKQLQPAAVAARGHVVILSANGVSELTRQAVWGSARNDSRLMQAVKSQCDPHNILNPGRFVFSG